MYVCVCDFMSSPLGTSKYRKKEQIPVVLSKTKSLYTKITYSDIIAISVLSKNYVGLYRSKTHKSYYF